VTTKRLPETLIEAIRYFTDIDVCTEFVAAMRWPEGPVCERCGGMEHSYLATRRVWKCKGCKRQFSVKVGTIFEDSPLGLDKWLPAVWLIANSKNGISSHELGRALGITQKSAWFMLHRIRLAMQDGSFDKIDGIAEVDETFIGGKARNMHKAERARKITGTGGKDKTIVVGALERGGKVRASVVEDRSARTLQGYVRENVTEGAPVYTDALNSYTGLNRDYEHETVDHAIAYVDGQIHSNGIENFWALLKRGLHGTYISVEPFHLFRYLDERVFTFNMREMTDLGRFTYTLGSVTNRRLTYKALTGKA
jgi:transposase-like protein